MRVATFIHIGDVHIHTGPRQADRLAALDYIIAYGLRLPHLGAWLIPGDVFDARSSIEDRNEWKERVKRMANRAPVIEVDGNHDRPGDLDIFADLGATYPIYGAAVPRVQRFALATGDAATVFMMPYPTEAGLVGQGVSPHRLVQTARESLESIFIDAGEQLRAARAAGDLTLMVGHVNVAGSIMATGQPNIGAEIEIDGALLARLGPCYKGLNHIHKAQEIDGAWYAGSICRLNWGEVEPKSFIVVDYVWEDAAGESIFRPVDALDEVIAGRGLWRFNVVRCPVDVAPLYHVEGEMTRDGFTWRVTDGPDGADMPAPETWAGCEVRVRARYKQSEGVILGEAQARVKAEFAAARRFEFEPVCVPDRGLRAPEVALARTLPDKILAWAKVVDVVLPATAAAQIAALETQDPADVIAGVELRMAALGNLDAPISATEEPAA